MRIKRHTLATALLVAAVAQADNLDVVRFGDGASESAHDLQALRSEVVTGALDQPARQLLPLEPASWYGGNVSFDLKVDPVAPNYFTLKLWGGDFGQDRGQLILLCEGKQVGLRHLGDVDQLDILSDDPRFPGRFSYITTILPRQMTAGKRSVRVEVRGLGRIWGYGDTWERFQKPVEKPSRSIYAAYSHTEPMFIPPAEEKQGEAPAKLAPRTDPGVEVLQQIKDRVAREIDKMLAADTLDQMRLQLLARAYHTPWTQAYQNPKVIQQLLRGMDQLYLKFAADPKLAQFDRSTWNADWFGFGPMGDAIRLTADKLQPHLDENVAGTEHSRREAYAEMLLAAREWHRMHRRQYTNQSMIKDLYGIYFANRALQIVAPGKAMTESDARRYLYESVGLQPWLGNDLPEGGSAKPLGGSYMQLTENGLTKELGYVGSYGEVLDWTASIYDATRPAPDAEGDPKIKAQLIKIAKARAAFRYRLVDQAGHPAMVLETVVGWRDNHYPGYIAYAQRPTRDAGPFQAAIATMDPELLGYSKQMLEEGQFFNAMEGVMREGGFRVSAGLLETPADYETIRSLPAGEHKLPMSPGQPDFVFADEENGVVAIKHGDEIFYASLYWRARYAVNSLARVHYLTPRVERVATVWQDVSFDDSGMTYTRDNRIMEHQTRRHEKNADLDQAMAGEVLPIAKTPDGLDFKPGRESVHAGRGTFYTLRYGPYTIAMNMTADRTFDVQAPDAATTELTSRKPVMPRQTLQVPPRSTVVLRAAD